MNSVAHVLVPADLWQDDNRTGSIILWLHANGTMVHAGDVIAELMVDKVTVELEAPASGRLTIMAGPEALVHKGDLVAEIG